MSSAVPSRCGRFRTEARGRRAAAASSTELVEDLFRKEYAHLVSALTRVLGPSNIPLAEDVVHDALVSAMHAWRFGLPKDPKAWIIRAAHNRAIDIIRRDEPKLSRYPFYWAARADLERRAGRHTAARENYSRAIALARSQAERESFQRRIESLTIS